MMMRMIVAAGIQPLTDSLRQADEDNPRGYFELEAVKQTKASAAWLADAPGKVVKVIHVLLKDLPASFQYRIVFMHRDLDEVLASQKKMLERSGRSGAALPAEALKKVFAAQLDAARKWAASQPNCSCLDVKYAEVVANPAAQASRIAEFIGVPGKAAEMAAAVEASLYRNRSVPGA